MNHILLVEDNLDNQLVVSDIFELEEIDARLVAVGNAEEALRRVRRLAPVLILMDLGLPGMSGLDATRRLKADEDTAGIPVWALTAHAMKRVADEAMAAGCDQYLTKPIAGADLAARLHAFLDSHRKEEFA